MELVQELKDIQNSIVQSVTTAVDGLKLELKVQRTLTDELKARIDSPDFGGREHKQVGGLEGYQSPGARFTEQKDLIDLIRKTGRGRAVLDTLHPAFESKTLIDSAALGFSTPGVLTDQRVTDAIVPLPRRRLTVRDLLRSKPVTAGQISWIQELAFTNASSPQVEGDAKGESANTFQIASEKVRTLATWIPITRQAIDDLAELRRFLDENLIYNLKVLEESELLFGDASGDHLHGIAHQATAYAATYAAAGDTKLDILRRAVMEAEAADEEVSAFILNPVDCGYIDLLKTDDGGANKGAYIVGDPLGGALRVRTYWSRPVVATNVMPAGRFLAGNFANAIIGDRMGATIDVSDSHDDYFVKNKLAIRAEERISLAVLRPSSFRYGGF